MAEGAAVPAQARRHRACTSATARRCASRSSSTSSRPSRRASASRCGTSSATSRSSATRTSARCSRSPQNASKSCRPTDFELESDKKYIVSVGSRRPAARLRQPRELHGLRQREKRFEFKRIEYDIESAADKVCARGSSATSPTASSSASEQKARLARDEATRRRQGRLRRAAGFARARVARRQRERDHGGGVRLFHVRHRCIRSW